MAEITELTTTDSTGTVTPTSRQKVVALEQGHPTTEAERNEHLAEWVEPLAEFSEKWDDAKYVIERSANGLLHHHLEAQFPVIDEFVSGVKEFMVAGVVLPNLRHPFTRMVLVDLVDLEPAPVQEEGLRLIDV